MEPVLLLMIAPVRQIGLANFVNQQPVMVLLPFQDPSVTVMELVLLSKTVIVIQDTMGNGVSSMNVGVSFPMKRMSALAAANA
jgi:hypothetical protein